MKIVSKIPCKPCEQQRKARQEISDNRLKQIEAQAKHVPLQPSTSNKKAL